MSKSHSDSNAYSPRVAAVMARGASMAARVQRFRVDEVLREIGRRGRLPTHAAPIAWGFGGFLVGAIFWHLIGFWGVLGSVVLTEPENAVSVVTRQQPVVVARRQVAEPAILPNCTVLALDRSTGRTSSVPCPEHLPMLEEARSHRQDLAFAGYR